MIRDADAISTKSATDPAEIWDGMDSDFEKY